MLQQEHIDRAKQLTGSHNGKALNQQALLKPHPLVAKILLARFMSMTPQQQQSLKTVLNPQNAEALQTLLPEMKAVIQKGLANGG